MPLQDVADPSGPAPGAGGGRVEQNQAGDTIRNSRSRQERPTGSDPSAPWGIRPVAVHSSLSDNQPSLTDQFNLSRRLP